MFFRNPLLALIVGAALIPASAMAAPRQRPQADVLWNADQRLADAILLRLLADPQLKAEQARLRAELAATPRGASGDGAASLDFAIASWTNSLIYKELLAYGPKPVLLWGTEDTPRAWHGYVIGSTGTSGDNPDNIYRSMQLDGAGRYVIEGRFDMARRPAQLVLELGRGEAGVPPQLGAPGGRNSDIGGRVGLITDRDLAIAPDGSFRITLGGEGSGPGHIALVPGPIAGGFRDVLSDWNQVPARLTIRRIDPAPAAPQDYAALRRRVIEHLGPYVRFWAHFPDIWFGGLAPNTISDPSARDGGWGFVAGLHFKLAPDEAILVTTTRGAAPYTGFQLCDPWMIARDARAHLTSLNITQAAPNADGSTSFVIARSDPGVANWLDTAGLGEGYGIVRWQGTPQGTTKDGLIREFRVIKLAEAAKIAGIAHSSPMQRRAQLSRRAAEWAKRLN